MQYSTPYKSPLGEMILTGDEQSLCGIYFLHQKHFPVELPPLRPMSSSNTAAGDPLNTGIQQLGEYFDGLRDTFDLPLKPAGTAFQHSVWKALLEIPCGETRSYQQLAALIGKPRATRAVAAAIGRNPISIIIPCHRVIGSNGKLTGYAGGLDRKEALLALERIALERK